MAPLRTLTTQALVNPSEVVVPRALGDARFVVHPHNWLSPFRMVTRWDTDVVTSFYANSETRVAASLRPTREVTSTHTEGDSKLDFLRQWIGRLSPRELAPGVTNRYLTFGTNLFAQALISCDVGVVTGTNPANNQVSGDFTGMRFFEGQRAAILNKNLEPFEVGGERVQAVPVTLSTVSRTLLVFDVPPVTVTTDMLIIPVIDVYHAEDVSMAMQTSRVVEAEVTLVEGRGQSQLPPLVSKGFIPLDFQEFQGRFDTAPRAVLQVDQNWSFQPVEQQSRSLAEGPLPLAGGQRPRRGVAVNTGLSRLDHFRVARLFDSMQGAAGTFWAVMPQVIDSSATRTGLNEITIAPRGNHNEWAEQHFAVAFMKDDGTWSIHEVFSVSNDWRLGVFQDVPDQVIGCLHWATYARFTDELVEEWDTAGVVNVAFTVMEDSFPVDEELLAP